MIIIADSGSTKTSWAIVDHNRSIDIHTAGGINPALLSTDELTRRLNDQLTPLIAGSRPDAIHFYGAGCRPDLIPVVSSIITRLTGCTDVNVGSDMLGAARAVCGHRPGIAAILGTGSNSCLFDGQLITSNIPPLGYILGDEGSGAALGRRLISLLFKTATPSQLQLAFTDETGLSLPDIIRKVYREPDPNRFLASLTPFMARHISDIDIDAIVTDEFSRFLRLNILPYPDATSMPVGFIGSIACHFSTQLHAAARNLGLSISKIIAAPLSDIVSYHLDCR